MAIFTFGNFTKIVGTKVQTYMLPYKIRDFFNVSVKSPFYFIVVITMLCGYRIFPNKQSGADLNIMSGPERIY